MQHLLSIDRTRTIKDCKRVTGQRGQLLHCMSRFTFKAPDQMGPSRHSLVAMYDSVSHKTEEHSKLPVGPTRSGVRWQRPVIAVEFSPGHNYKYDDAIIVHPRRCA